MMTNKKSANYVDQSQIDILEKELKEIGDKFPYLVSLGETELHRLKGGIAECVDLFSNRKVKVRAKVHIPVNQYPSINFVGKLLGPGATTLRGIQEQTNTKMTIIGAGVLKGRKDEMNNNKNNNDKKLLVDNSNSQQKLHLQIDSLGTPAEAYYRLSHALIEVQNCMIHVSNDFMLNSNEERLANIKFEDNESNVFSDILTNFNNKKPNYKELPRGVIQPYHPISPFNWNNYMFNTAAYDNYLNNGYKGFNKSNIYNNSRYRNMYNYKSKRINNNDHFDANNGGNNTKRFNPKNGPAGDEIQGEKQNIQKNQTMKQPITVYE